VKRTLKKKVCMLVSVQQPFEVRLFHREAKTLVEAGYLVTIIAQYDKTEIVDGVRIVGIGKTGSRFSRILHTAKIFNRALAERADIYQVHNPELLLWGVLLKFFTKRPVIYDVHEDFPDAVKIRDWIPRYLRGPLSLMVDIYERVLTRLIDYVVTADEQTSGRFLHSNKRVLTLFNFPRIAYLKGIANVKKTSKSVKIVIHAGSLSPERGGDIMLEAFKTVKEVVQGARLLLIGDFTTPYGLNLKRKVIKYGLEDSVTLVDYLPHEQVLEYIAKSDVGLSLLQPVPKFMKNIPQKIFEYMACGVPSVISDLPPVRPFIETSQAGILVSPSNPVKIAESIVFLLQHPEEARKMGESGRRAVLEEYNWEKESKKLLEVYEELLTTLRLQ